MVHFVTGRVIVFVKRARAKLMPTSFAMGAASPSAVDRQCLLYHCCIACCICCIAAVSLLYPCPHIGLLYLLYRSVIKLSAVSLLYRDTSLLLYRRGSGGTLITHICVHEWRPRCDGPVEALEAEFKLGSAPVVPSELCYRYIHT